MKNVAVTGISGYIGGRIASRLNELEDVNCITGIDIKPPQYSLPKLKFYCQDISKPLGEIFAENKVDAAINLAFVVKPTHDNNTARQIDIGGISNFLDGCKQAQVKHILYLSSHTVYGAHPDNIIPLNEDAPLHPLQGFQYSRDKAEAERILQDFAASNEDVCVTILRSCPVIGPHAANSIVTKMFKSVMIRVVGYDPSMQFVHEDDLAEIIATFLIRPKAGIFNVSGDGEIRYSEVARLRGKRSIALPEKLLRLLMGFSWMLRLQNESPVSGLEFIKYPPIVSTQKLKSELGFKFKYSSRDALLSFLERKVS